MQPLLFLRLANNQTDRQLLYKQKIWLFQLLSNIITNFNSTSIISFYSLAIICFSRIWQVSFHLDTSGENVIFISRNVKSHSVKFRSFDESVYKHFRIFLGYIMPPRILKIIIWVIKIILKKKIRWWIHMWLRNYRPQPTTHSKYQNCVCLTP